MPTYTVTGDHNPSTQTDILEVSYVNFEVVVGGTVSISLENIVNGSGGNDDPEFHLYRKENDGTLTLVLSNLGGAVNPAVTVADLQPGTYILAISEEDVTDADARAGLNPEVGSPDALGGDFEVVILDGATAGGTLTSVVSISDGFDANPLPADFVEDSGVVTFTAEDLVTDPDSDPLDVVAIRSVVGGTAVINADGDVEFTPDPNYDGPYSFVYDVTDGPGGGIVTGVQSGNITSVGDAPAGTDNAVTFDEDTVYTFTAGDFGFTDPLDTPADNFDGVVITGLEAADGTLFVDTNANDTFDSGEEVVNGQTVSIADINAGNLQFQPDANENNDTNGAPYTTFQFAVRDDSGTGTPQDPTPNTMTVNVTALDDDDYVANDDGGAGTFITLTEDTASGVISAIGAGSITENDDNPDPDAFVVSSISNLFLDVDGAGPGIPVQVGTIAYNLAAQTYVITPDPNFNTGSTSPTGDARAYFDYTVQTDDGTFDTGRVYVEVTSVNDAPVPGAAQNTDTQTEDQNLPFDINDANDLQVTLPDYPLGAPDEDNDPFDYQLVAGSVTRSVNGGAASVIADGNITITDQAPRDADYNYNDLTDADQALDDGEFATISFQYVVRDAGPDGIAGNGDDATSAPQTITLTITGVNDAPVAVDDEYDGDEDTTLNVSAADGVLNGPTAVHTTAGPDTDVDVEPLFVVADAGNSTAGGTYVINADGSFSYTPPADYNGPDTFNYEVSDGDLTDVGTVTINVDPSPDGPTAEDDVEGPVTEDVPGQAAGLAFGGIAFRTEANGFFLESDLLANDDDPDLPGDTLDITSVGSPIGGTVTLFTSFFGTQYVVFTPDPNFSGPAQFDYTVTDSTGNSDIGRVTFNVNETADGPPVAGNDTIVVTEQVTQTITAAELLGNDTDPDNDGAGAGTDQLFVRSVQDLVNARFSAGADNIYNTADDGNFVFDAFGNILSFEIETLSDQNGLDASFSYTVDDSAARPGSPAYDPRVAGAPDVRTGTDLGTVTLDVTAVEDTPIANTDNLGAVNEDSLVGLTFTQGALLANDSDPDNAGGSNAGLTVVTVAGLTPGSGASAAVFGGTVTANANGTFTFVPAADFFGTASFNYTITDPTGRQDQGAVNITVNSINDAPNAVDDPGGVLGLLQPENFAAPAFQNNANQPNPTGISAPLVVEDGVATFTWAQLLGNDNAGPANEDQDLQILSGSSAFGNVAVDSVNQLVTFTPNPGVVGPATFTYVISDGGQDDNLATAGDNLTDSAVVNVYIANQVNGSAGDDILTPDPGDLAVELNGLGGNDNLAGTVNTDQLNGGNGNDTLNGNGGDDYLDGGAGNDTANGGDGDDRIFTDAGGTDTVNGGAGNDAIFAGNALSFNDSNDGGAGINTLAIQGGGYAGGYNVGALNLVNIQNLITASGTVAGLWKNPVAGTHDYNLIFQDANIAAGAILTVIANGLGNGIPGLQAGEDLTLDFSDEKDGGIRVFAGLGNDNIIGGEGSDGVFNEAGAWSNVGHSFDGRNGPDSMAWRGAGYNGAGAIVTNGVQRVENFVLLSEGQTTFGGLDNGSGTFDYTITTVDSNTDLGATLRIDGAALRSTETLIVNANAETDANLVIFGGNANDTLSGGLQGGINGNTDLIFGGNGGDLMNGGSASGILDGQNVYGYTSAAQSAATATSLAGIDRISGFDPNQVPGSNPSRAVDLLDINAGGPATNGFALGIAGLNVTDVNAVAGGSLSLNYGFGAAGNAAQFNADLAAQINGALNPGQGAILRVSSGDLAGSEVFVADTNGDGNYNAGDLVIIFDNGVSQLPPNVEWLI